MQGNVLDFSVQTNTGLISGQDGRRYSFTGQEWKESELPKRGLLVDFEGTADGQATGVYRALSASVSKGGASKSPAEYSPIDWYMKALKQYVVFHGRAGRQEFWFFALFTALGAMAALIIDEILRTEIMFYALYIMATFLPMLGVSVRRLHDTGKSGWWYLLSLLPLVGLVVLVIWFAKAGDTHANMYGEPSV